MRGLYLLHFEPRYQHAGHYLGYSKDIDARVAEHLACNGKSSPLVKAAVEAGCEVTVARLIPGGTRTLERKLKNQGGLAVHCPICYPRRRFQER